MESENKGWDQEPTSGGGTYLKLEPNTSAKLRIISDHPIAFTDTYKDGTRKDRWAVLAIVKERDGKKVPISTWGFAFGVSIFKAIRELWRNDEWGNPTGYDITIKRDGAELETKYTVIPSPAKPLTAEEVALIESCDLDLVKMYVKDQEQDEFA